MRWDVWAEYRRISCGDVNATCKSLGGISKGCFWRMTVKNKQPNENNLKRIANALGLTVWELMREVYEFDDFTKKEAADSSKSAA